MSEEESGRILRAHCAVLLLLLARVASEREEKMDLFKCCGPYEMLSGNGQYCVSASWPRDESLNVMGNVIENVQPSNQQWMNRWVPPNISTHHLRIIYLNAFRIYDFPERKASVRVVEEAVKWNESEELAQGIGYWRSNRVAFERDGVFRTINKPRTFSSPRRSVYSLTYCVDAALEPLSPFALYSESDFRYEECIIKCCRPAHVVELHGNFWECESDARGNWTPDNTSLKGVLPTDVPFESSADFMTCIARNSSSTHPLRLSPEDTWASYLLRDRFHHFFFSSWETCFDYERREDKTLRETLFYCEESRISRGIYWLMRPLCFVSASLLAVALLSVASNSSMRVKEHGWCLACHAVCLLAFNLGQVAYFMTLSNEVDLVFRGPPNHLINVCLKIGFTMYFLLMAANCWLTALCMNMALGFGKLQVARPSSSKNWKRFLALSTFAWGLPVIMTGLYVHAYERKHIFRKWYNPTLVETRTCFDERNYFYGILKPSTTLFYYGPVSGLVLVNFVCIARTLKKVQFLRRGHSVLRRDDDQLHHQTEGRNPRPTKAQINKATRSTMADAKAIRMYVKMIIMTGISDIFVEVIVWLTTDEEKRREYYEDHMIAYRITGYVFDFSRAVCVAWLAAPEEGYLNTAAAAVVAGRRHYGAEERSAVGAACAWLATPEGDFGVLRQWLRGGERGEAA